jgi:predicted dehydrogenase
MIGAGIKVGLAGSGFIGPVHLEALRRLDIQVLGLCEETPEKAKEKANELGIAKSYSSLKSMLADANIQAIHLATPNYLHYPQAKAALLAGKHVICEKPLAMNTAESEELVRLAKDAGLVAVVNFNLRYYPLNHQARAIIQSGEIGEVYIIRGSYLQDWLLLPTDWNWRLEPDLGGELRAVADIGSHWLDLVQFVTGLRIKAVFADFQTFLKTRKKPAKPLDTFSGKLLTAQDYVDQTIQTEDYATILLRFEGQVRGVLTVSQVSAGRKNQLFYEIDGAKSAIAWNSERPNELWVGHRERPNEVLLKDPALMSPEAQRYSDYPAGHNEGYPDTFKQIYSAVYEYIRAGDYNAPHDFPTFEDGHAELLLGEAILHSAREGGWVELA